MWDYLSINDQLSRKAQEIIMKTVIFPLIILLISVLISCGNSSTGPSGPTGAGQYYPLTIGNTWDLQLNGTFTSDSLPLEEISGEISWIITDDTTHSEDFLLFNWQETSIMEISISGQTIFTDTLIFVNYVTEVDSVIRAYNSPSASIYRIWMKYPIAVGDWWYSDPEFPSRIMTVLSVDTSITVPAGSFNECVYIQQTEPEFPDSYVDYFYAPGVGPIKYIVHAELIQSVYHSVAEMVEYSVL